MCNESSTGAVTARRAEKTAAGIYIHIPFCLAKCHYCDFYSITDLNLIPDYMDALLAEVTHCRQMLPVADTIYFGGGTPSVLTPRQVGMILERVQTRFSITGDAEITLEVNPGTVDEKKLAAYRSLGINRLNIGLQSLNEKTLGMLQRIHSANQALEVYRWARAIGFDNVGLDLIYGIPDQTLTMWAGELSDAVNLGAEHLSCYTLTVEQGTPLSSSVRNGTVKPLDEKIAGELFTFTADHLNSHGYRQYEISNYARHGAGDDVDWRSRHNRKYWTMAPYLGLGAAAHSFLDNRRWWNQRSIKRYREAIKSGNSPMAGSETLTREQQIMEFVYLGLRQTAGIDSAGFKFRFDTDFFESFGPVVTRLIHDGLVEKTAFGIRLTARGMRYLEHVVDTLLE
jgi:oxygen-independent coproporphyrinogen-3 oxidase